jgi:imidazole glycerol-phosphate synthase subunit HisF
MLRSRIIFSLIYDNGFFTQSRNFRLQRVGDVGWLEKFYKFQKIAFSLDELIVLDATREKKSIAQFSKTLSRLVDDVFIPVSAGGGIRNLSDADMLFKSGADKIVLNTTLYKNKVLVDALVKKYGSQSIVGSVDYKNVNNKQTVYVENGTEPIRYTLDQYIEIIQKMNIGEIYLNSIDKDGTGFGYDLETINHIGPVLKLPLIVAGGAGNEKHFKLGLQIRNVNAVATANLFNFIGDGLPNARKSILEQGMNIAKWI